MRGVVCCSGSVSSSQPEGEFEEELADLNTGDTPQCLVLGCSGAAEQVWTVRNVATHHGIVTWPVCRAHYRRLVAGEPWEAVTGGPRSFRRWMLMGRDLDTMPRPMPRERPRLVKPDEDS
jgi:hypothetical protein